MDNACADIFSKRCHAGLSKLPRRVVQVIANLDRFSKWSEFSIHCRENFHGKNVFLPQSAHSTRVTPCLQQNAYQADMQARDELFSMVWTFDGRMAAVGAEQSMEKEPLPLIT